MANDGTGQTWDEAAPGDGAVVSSAPQEVRDLRKGVALRLAKEHVDPAAGSVGGEHKAGSAVVYVGSGTDFSPNTEPTYKPDGTTALDSDDEGRLWWDGSTLWQYSGTVWVALTAPAVAILRETQTSGVRAGGLVAGQWTKRTLVETQDTNSIVTVSSGVFTLGAGHYIVRAWATGFKCNGHQIRLQNTTANTTVITGISALSSEDDASNTVSTLQTELVLTGSTNFELQHNCQTTVAVNGAGERTSVGTETYAQVEIQRL